MPLTYVVCNLFEWCVGSNKLGGIGYITAMLCFVNYDYWCVRVCVCECTSLIRSQVILDIFDKKKYDFPGNF